MIVQTHNNCNFTSLKLWDKGGKVSGPVGFICDSVRVNKVMNGLHETCTGGVSRAKEQSVNSFCGGLQSLIDCLVYY